MTENILWNSLLNLKEKVELSNETIINCLFNAQGDVLINGTPTILEEQECGVLVCFDSVPKVAERMVVFKMKENTDLELIQSGNLEQSAILFLKKYLAFCFLSILSKKYKRTITVAHLAQTLDGKIATQSGDSKWIGNKENLIHAHRMRALCNGILIGNKTLENDQPSLTVRLIEGKNPQRIVLGTSYSNFSSLKGSDKKKVIVIGCSPQNWNGYIDYVQMDGVNGNIPPKEILKMLYQKGIKSIYLEGGASTTSNFIDQSAVDILQLHIAPLVFGSGKSSISLPLINEVKEAIQFKKYNFFQVGTEIMFSGYLNKANED